MLKIVFEDPYIMVIDKPAGLVVTRSETQKGETIEDILVSKHGEKLERGGVVHRLDKDTSGLLIVAKTSASLESLQNQFKNRQVKKSYLALVHGELNEEGRIEGSIGRNPFNREKFSVFETSVKEGKEAITEYQPLAKLKMSDDNLQKVFAGFNKIQMRRLGSMHYPLFTLLNCYPLTGRTHQIRVHLKYIGFPVVADEKYGGRKVVRLDKRWCPRQFLHAAKISFIHPAFGNEMTFESKLPEDLLAAQSLLEPVKI